MIILADPLSPIVFLFWRNQHLEWWQLKASGLGPLIYGGGKFVRKLYGPETFCKILFFPCLQMFPFGFCLGVRKAI